MALLQVRGVPETSHRTLKARAAARGQSLNAYLLELIQREVARPTVAEVLERAAQRSEQAQEYALPHVLAAREERAAELIRARPR